MRCLVVVALAVTAGALGCARQDAMTRPAAEPDSVAVDTFAGDFQPPTQAAPLPSDTAPAPASDPMLEPPLDLAAQPQASPAAESPPPPRDDGRPEWWSDLPAYEVQRIWVCAEALGVGMSEAKESALDRGRRKLRDILRLPPGTAIPDEIVERTSVIPLPRSGGDHSFAGYVLISAEVP